MRRRKVEVVEGVQEKVLDVNASMQGTLRFDDPVNLRISGKFEGTLDTKGSLMIGENADIKANITGEIISVAGNINGNVKATEMISLESTARLKGDIETLKLSVSEGAVVNGRIHMVSPQTFDNAEETDWMNLKELAEYLEVDSNKIKDWVNDGMLPGTRNGKEWMFERAKVDAWITDGKIKG
ncbi:MAG: polymer-forming cytoskeletal protein [Candidatus Omnitrophota bacterium]|nr:polymer-forming cytoskeletal protein [Candidatus Omnitrophota bacterium]